MKRILLWLVIFGMTVYSLVSTDLRPLAFALALSLSMVLWEWIEQRRKR